MKHMQDKKLKLWMRGGLMLALLLGAAVARGAEGLSGNELIGAVRPLRAELYSAAPAGERAARLMGEVYQSIMAWDRILLDQARPAKGRAGCLNYGLESNVENDVRPIAYAALVNAFLTEFAPPPGQAGPPEPTRERMRSDARAALRYLVQGHVSGGGSCTNGKPWGNQWQSAMWTRSAGLAGWILWPKLDRELQGGVARLVEHEADRFLEAKPKSSEFRDTGAEENAWNAQVLTLACNMMPGHPRAGQWAEAAKLWMYNSLSAAADRESDARGDDGRRIRDWVRTVNVHPDFTVENHGLVHVGYLKTSLALLLENAVPYLMAGNEAPQACLHHAAECFGVAARCMGWDGAPVFFGGNDWKLFHSQDSDTIVYTMMALLARNRAAAHLEEAALPWLRRMQQENGGYYNVRRDLESGGMCATRLISGYLARLALGEGPMPASQAEFEAGIQGVHYLQYGKAILHRTPSKFVSFCWGSRRMGLVMPREGTWVIWPHFASATGLIGGKEATEKDAPLTGINHQISADGFTVTAALERMKGAVRQTVAWASPAGDVAVYIERLEPRRGTPLPPRETGIVGLDYELGDNTRTLHGAAGEVQAVGVGGEQPRVVEIRSDWLNINGRVGYVVKRFPERPNAMRYHDEVEGSGRVPVLQEWISMIGEPEGAESAEGPEWACLVTFLNQPEEKTREWRGRVAFSVEGDAATCRIGGEVVRADFGKMKTTISGASAKNIP